MPGLLFLAYNKLPERSSKIDCALFCILRFDGDSGNDEFDDKHPCFAVVDVNYPCSTEWTLFIYASSLFDVIHPCFASIF